MLVISVRQGLGKTFGESKGLDYAMNSCVRSVYQGIDLWIRDSSYVSRSLWSVICLSRCGSGSHIYHMMVTGGSIALLLGIFLVIVPEICWC